MWSNFHTHSQYCDGKGALSDYLNEAVKNGMRHLGFSSHAPLPFQRNWSMKPGMLPQYLAEINSLKPLFPDVEIYKGLEADYIPGLIQPSDFAPRLDYTIGSIHFVGNFQGEHWEIDSTFDVFRTGLTNIFDNNIREAITQYFSLTREMLVKSPPDILGHMDKIKINSLQHFFDESEPWYREAVDKTLKAVSSTRTKVEVNTRGLYKKKSGTPYPSPWILERIHGLQIPVILNSDAHHPDELTREFDAMISLLKDIGFKTLSVLDAGVWKEMPLNQYAGH